MYQDTLITVIYWSFYLVLHSLLASDHVKLLCERHLPILFVRYRIVYNFIATAGLIWLAYYLASTPSKVLLPVFAATKYIGLVLASWGVIIVKVSFKHYSTREFLGFKEAGNPEPLIKEGLLKHVRHPIYSGTILILLGFFLYIPNLLNMVSVLCILVYLIFGIKSEEEKLIQLYGEDYLEYRKSTPALIPKLFH